MTPTAGRPRAVIFDLDETLHRLRRFTVGGYAHVAGVLAGRTGRPRGEIFGRLWRLYRSGQGARAYQTICVELGLPEDAAAELLRHHRAHTPRLRLTASASDALSRLRPSWTLGVLTNGIPELQRIKIAALGLETLVDRLVIADEVVPGGKPAPIVFARICDVLRVPPERSVMVGDDGMADAWGGREAGLRTIWLRRPNRPEPPADAADAVVDSLREVPAVAERLVGE